MHPRSPKLLEDIRDAAAFIRQVTQGLTLDDYRGNRLLRHAVERNFEIIGEAIKRLATADPRTAARIGDYRQIIAFRNVLIHGYDLVDFDLVWQAVETQVVTLLRDVEALLAPDARRLPTGLYVLTPDTDDDEWLAAAVAAAIRGGASSVQYRNKLLDEAGRLRQARRIAKLCRETGTIFIVNDSVEIAVAAGADGVHIGRDDGDLSAARAALGPQAVIGVSCYDSFERAWETREIADYCAFGSVFVSAVKPGAVRAPLALFGKAREAGLHAVAIGGIDAGNARRVFEAGAVAVAVITAVFGKSKRMGDSARADSACAESRLIETNARRVAEIAAS